MAKEKRGIVPKEERESQLMDLAKGFARSIFAEPTPYAAELGGIGVGENDPIGVGSAETFAMELELGGITDAKERRLITTTTTGRIKKREMIGLFPYDVSFQTVMLPDGTEIFYRSDIAKRNDPEKNAVLRRYDAYKDLLDKALEEKHRSQQERQKKREAAAKREKEEKEARQRAEMEEAAAKAERDAPSIVVVQSIPYNRGAEDSLQAKIAQFEQTCRIIPEYSKAVFQELPDPTAKVNGVFGRLFPSRMTKRILDQGVTEEVLGQLITSTRDRLVSVFQGFETDIDKKTMDLLADVNQIMEQVNSRQFVFPVPVLQSLAPLMHTSLYFLRPQNIVINPLINLDSDSLRSSVDGALYTWAFRYDHPFIQGKRQELMARAQEPQATLLLRALDDNTIKDIYAIRNGEVLDVLGNPVSLADLDRFVADLAFPDNYITYVIFADVLREIFVPDSMPNPLTKEVVLQIIALAARSFFSFEEIKTLLLPEVIDEKVSVVDLQNKIRATQQMIDDPMYSPQIKETLKQEIERLRREIALASEKRPTKADRIKSIVQARMPQEQPKDKNYRMGENSNAFKAAQRQYEQLSKESNLFTAPNPKEYVDGKAGERYKGDDLLYSIFVLSEKGFPSRISEPSLLPEFSF